MAEMFQFPEIKIDRDRMIMFRTPFPQRDDELTMRIAGSFRLQGRLKDIGSRTLVRDRKSVLEVFHASDSLRWSQQNEKSVEASRRVDLPEESRAIELAQTFLRERNLEDPRASVLSVSYTQFARMERDQVEAEDFPIALHVNFGFVLDTLPVLGPGAKIQVTFGSKEQVVEVYKFWREATEDQVREIIPLDAAMEVLRADQAYADLRAGEARVVFRRIRLGYFALPPREVQGYLIPVYAFDGTVSTPYLERYDFTKYVVAVKISPDEVKRLGMGAREPVAAF